MARLSKSDRDLWRSFRHVYEHVGTVVERDLLEATELSGADYGVLARIAETAQKQIRQQDLADAMRWDRTRLSHHLTRMEGRGLIERSKVGATVTHVRATPDGERLRVQAEPVHAAAVMKHFIARLSSEQRLAIAALAASIP